jgi:hypothetical protein
MQLAGVKVDDEMDDDERLEHRLKRLNLKRHGIIGGGHCQVQTQCLCNAGGIGLGVVCSTACWAWD